MSSRTKNTTRNIMTGLINQCVSIVLPFINRTAILWIMGAEFTGLSGLFSSILNVLSIAELGFNSAIVYSLYRPMQEKNEEQICILVSLIRKIYYIVGTVIFLGGIVVLPFIKWLIHSGYPEGINIYVIYLLYLMNSVISYYLFAYKECLLIADQRKDIADNIRTITNIVRYFTQFAVLFITRNFYYYLVVAIVGTIVTSFSIGYATKKRYPYYHLIKEKITIPSDLRKRTQGLLIDKISNTCRNSFDSLIVSSYLGLTATAIYGNYYYIFSSVYGIMLVICNAMSASVGNSIVTNSIEKNHHDLMIFSLLEAWLSGWATICLLCLYQPFMKIWAGPDLLLSNGDMMLFCLYFYLINMTNIRNQYISGKGLWWRLKSLYIAQAFGNLFLNLVLGKVFGISGIIWATNITIFFLDFLCRNYILFDNYFGIERLGNFLIEHLIYAGIILVASIVTYSLCVSLPFQGWGAILVRSGICVVLPNMIFAIGFRLSPCFKDSMIFAKRAIHTVVRKV